ncbi:GTP-binding protein [Psychromonas sp. B3M02]|uniref:CobW family GTP-binding protein n=1 Tax=Psychromonas sp. B3M02 TaxID=2267226 RepID=UPI000DEA4990|nr:GTP-binding protein [Psychromonas sp. B3M02]RBW46895.1 GTP-binding protein [Psychromonas sp. B3M02]
MRSDNPPILGVPTNIITGFLGVGKTSAILNLIKSKPKNERWAILVNEFGEVGVDGCLVQSQQDQSQQVFIREVPGGCMCCAAGLPMQVALNQLLLKAKPDRLLIEPTGLGHPKEVLQVLSTDHYRNVLLLQNNITLVDARHLVDPRYTNHETFNQQIAIADIVVGNKQDLYQANDAEKLKAYVLKVASPETNVIFSEYGIIPLTVLDNSTDFKQVIPDHHNHHNHHNHHDHHDHHDHHHHTHMKALVSDMAIPDNGVLKAVNAGEGFCSVGWRFSASKVFQRDKLLSLFSELKIERMKAVLITEKGAFAYNLTADGLTETALFECIESRIEIIAEEIDESIETQLLSCIKQD